MATTNTYSFQEDGVVMIGATALDNVTNAAIQIGGGERPFEDRVSAGDTSPTRVAGMRPPLDIAVTLSLYDETGVAGTLKAYRRNHTTGEEQTITLRPQGTGTGLPELILNPPLDGNGMDLRDKSIDLPTGTNYPAVTGEMVWGGFFDEEPAWTTQA